MTTTNATKPSQEDPGRTRQEIELDMVTTLIYEKLTPVVKGAVGLSAERYADDDERIADFMTGALYGIAATYMHEHGPEGTGEKEARHLFVQMCRGFEAISDHGMDLDAWGQSLLDEAGEEVDHG